MLELVFVVADSLEESVEVVVVGVSVDLLKHVDRKIRVKRRERTCTIAQDYSQKGACERKKNSQRNRTSCIQYFCVFFILKGNPGRFWTLGE